MTRPLTIFARTIPRRAPHPCVFARAYPELVEGVGGDVALLHLIFHRARPDQTLAPAFPDSRPSQKTRRNGHPYSVGDAGEIEAWAARLSAKSGSLM